MPISAVVEALFWRLRNSGPWTDMPRDLGAWRTVYGWFEQWAANGLFARLLRAVSNAGGVICLVDGTHIPVHQCACNPRGGAQQQAMGRTRGGRNSKLMALTDCRGRLLSFKLIEGQAYEGRHVVELLPAGRRRIIVGDKGFDDDALRAAIEVRGHGHCFPAKANRKNRRRFNRRYYRMRFAVEDFFRRLKRWAGTATRRDKLARHYLAWVQFAAALDWMM